MNEIPKSYEQLTDQEKAQVKAYLSGMKAMQTFIVSQLQDNICSECKHTTNTAHPICSGIKQFIGKLEGDDN